jgi:hypothetical protein
MGNVSQDFYRREMYLFFPELQLCEHDWKVNRLATETYSSWYRKRKDKFAVTTKQIDTRSSGSTEPRQSKRPLTPLQLPPIPYTKKAKSSAPAPSQPLTPRSTPRPLFHPPSRPQPNSHLTIDSTPLEQAPVAAAAAAPITVSMEKPSTPAIRVLSLLPPTATNPASSSALESTPPLSHTSSETLDLDSESRAVCRRSASPHAAQAAETILICEIFTSVLTICAF